MLSLGLGISLRFLGQAGESVPEPEPTDTYYVLVAGSQILAGTDRIQVGYVGLEGNVLRDVALNVLRDAASKVLRSA